MKKVYMMMMCLTAMVATGTSLKAQEVTIVLNPGWTWISSSTTEAVDFATAFGDFTPMQGDVIKSLWGQSTYINGQWRGGISQFYPGYGYHYKSNRTVPVVVTFNVQQPAPQVVVTTSEPMDITANSATCGGNMVSSNGDYVSVTLRGICWGTNPSPTFNDNYIESGSGLGSFTVSMTELTSGIAYYVRAFAVTPTGTFYGEEMSFTTEHEFVDLGLPSGLLWATCNIGADHPEDYGDYFAWGETEPKITYTEYNYTYFDYPDILPPDHDAATANWGADWRMPTWDEWQELLDNTTSTWTTRNGVNGRLYTGSNGNSVFLPAAGCFFEDGLDDVGCYGYYWSSDLDFYGDWLSPAHFTFSSGGFWCSSDRYNGQSVRAVRVTPQSNGLFSVSDSTQVYFSQGNLQYQASTNTWKFADNQYDYFGSDNSNISSNYSGWIDLFGWGTSGWNNGNTYYQPWSSADYDESNEGELYGPPGQYDLTSSYANADWGYNPISNGGNQENQWRTLTGLEWSYVFNIRTTSSGIRYAKAKVNDVNGVILLPDDWSSNTYILSNTNDGSASFDSNTISSSQWTILEDAGAVFLPAAGYCYETSVRSVGSYGSYWSASYYGSYSAYLVYFNYSDFSPQISGYRNIGRSVRLVRVVE